MVTKQKWMPLFLMQDETPGITINVTHLKPSSRFFRRYGNWKHGHICTACESLGGISNRNCENMNEVIFNDFDFFNRLLYLFIPQQKLPFIHTIVWLKISSVLSWTTFYTIFYEQCGFICSTNTFTQNPQPIITARGKEDFLASAGQISRGKRRILK